MWPSQRLASIGLDSRQRKSRARRRDRRGIKPIVTLLEERTLLSQPGTWAAVAPLPTARVYLGAATGNDGTIYAIGGGNTSEVDAYNPPTNTWTKIAPLPWAGETSAVSDHGLIYAISGDSGSVAAYHPQTNIWSAVASLPTARSNFAATVDSDGTIYVMGGSGAHGVTNEVDTYNPATNSWTTVAPLPEPAAYITAAPATMVSSTSSVMIRAMALLPVQHMLIIQAPTRGVKSLVCHSTTVHGGSKALTLQPLV